MTRKWTTVPNADDVSFDNTTNGFDAENVQEAIEEAANSFSFREIVVDLRIRQYQQMVVHEECILSAELILVGDLVVF